MYTSKLTGDQIDAALLLAQSIGTGEGVPEGNGDGTINILGIDSEPTLNSGNLVTSGGILSAIKSIPKGEQGEKGDKGDPGTASVAIDDDTTSTTTTWSSSKIDGELDELNAETVHYTTNTVQVAGTEKNVSTISPSIIHVANGLIMGGTAARAGLVSRGICGCSTPDDKGYCFKDKLFLNYDGTNEFSASRNVVLQAGNQGDDLGNNMYAYSVPRGDIVKAWVTANTLPFYNLESYTTLADFYSQLATIGTDCYVRISNAVVTILTKNNLQQKTWGIIRNFVSDSQLFDFYLFYGATGMIYEGRATSTEITKAFKFSGTEL